jgi:hypothetical protein
MTIALYSQDTTPTEAAQTSADRGEIVHVQCSDRRAYADALLALLDDSEEFGGGDAELEIVGDLGSDSVRVHLSEDH